jgi:hypothetical protein
MNHGDGHVTLAVAVAVTVVAAPGAKALGDASMLTPYQTFVIEVETWTLGGGFDVP